MWTLQSNIWWYSLKLKHIQFPSGQFASYWNAFLFVRCLYLSELLCLSHCTSFIVLLLIGISEHIPFEYEIHRFGNAQKILEFFMVKVQSQAMQTFVYNIAKLRFMRTLCHVQRKSPTIQLNFRLMRRIELNRKVYAVINLILKFDLQIDG